MHLLVFIADTLSIKAEGWAKQLQQLTTYGTIIRDLYQLATSTCTVYVVIILSCLLCLQCQFSCSVDINMWAVQPHAHEN